MKQRRPRAFLSCSLRAEDRSFVKFVAKMIRGFGFIPCRTVGMYSAAPKPLYEQMREGIKAADCIIIAASPRYRQQDISERTKRKKGISEMIPIYGELCNTIKCHDEKLIEDALELLVEEDKITIRKYINHPGLRYSFMDYKPGQGLDKFIFVSEFRIIPKAKARILMFFARN